MKSSLPRPIVESIKFFLIPVLRWKWKRNETVSAWVKENKVSDEEIDWLVLNWQRHGIPIPPPPRVKQELLYKYAQANNCKYLVETSTFKGDMIYSQLANFEKLFSIELSEEYWQNAKERFEKNDHVTLLKGDSGVELPKLVSTLDKKAIFWLDGHYCGGVTAQSKVECPIYEELKCIFKENIDHAILIDDARMFNGTRDYPTLDELEAFIKKQKPQKNMMVDNDVIVVM